MSARRIRFRPIAAVVLAIAAAGCGSGGSSPAASTPAGATTPSPSPTPAPTPAPTVPVPAPSWTGEPLPDGVTPVDLANRIESVDLSPDGRLLAVLSSGRVYGTGRVDVLDAGGQRLSSFFAFKACWVDDSHLMTLAVSPDSTGVGTATVQPVDGSAGSVVAGQFSAIACNEHGLVAMSDPVFEYPGEPGFRIWSDGALGPRIDVRGSPVEWSPDGQYLAILDLNPSTSSPPGGLATGRAVGSQFPVIATVMRFPDQEKLMSGLTLYGPGIVTRFSPDSSSIVLSPTEPGTTAATTHSVVVALPGPARTPVEAGIPHGWTPAGKLILVDDKGRISLWSQAGTTPVPGAYQSAVFGPDEADFATLNKADPPTATVRHGDRSVVVPLAFATLTAAWASAGVCFIATSSTTPTQDDYLLRVDLR
jgi:hypothetical protein